MMETVEVYDLGTGETKTIPIEKFDELLEKLGGLINRCVEKLEKIDDRAKLKDFSINIGFKSGVWIISAEGGIKLNYELTRWKP